MLQRSRRIVDSLREGIGRKFQDPTYESICQTLIQQETGALVCLPTLLRALEWPGNVRLLAEALPHFCGHFGVYELQEVMKLLGYRVKKLPLHLLSLDPRLTPVLFAPAEGEPMVALKREEQGIMAFQGKDGSTSIIDDDIKGVVYIFELRTAEEIELSAKLQYSSVRDSLARCKPLLYYALLMSFVLNLLYLTTPFYIKSLYDYVVVADSISMLAGIAVGMLLALVGMFMMQWFRANFLLHVAAKVDKDLGNKIFERLLHLPPGFTENASVGSQISRIKDFDTAREFLLGPVMTMLFELPFIIVFIGAIALLNVQMALVPIVLLGLFIVIGLIVIPLLKKHVLVSAQASSRRQSFLVEALENMRALKFCAFEDTWQGRFHELSAEASVKNFRATVLTSFVKTLSDGLMMMAGAAVIVVGISGVFAGTITTGALIASMMLIWRILSPLKLMFSSMPRLIQIYASMRQVDALMRLNPEHDPKKLVVPIKNLVGAVEFNRVTLRYQPELEPALVGVSFKIEPGEVVSIVGGNGSGKSTILKLLLGLYPPQVGSVRVDNMDIRQLDIIELRHVISYIPQRPQFFYGTIAQNLRLVNPCASLEELEAACDTAGILEDIRAMPEGINSRLRDHSRDLLPASFQQRLSLARLYLRNASLFLLDEPADILDFEGDQLLMQTIDMLRGRRTVIMTTHRPSHMKAADRILVMHQGQLILNGAPGEVIPRLPKSIFVQH